MGPYGDYRIRTGTEATYSCLGGHEILSGSRVRTCKSSGQWDGEPAACPGDENACIALVLKNLEDIGPGGH